MVKPQLVYAGPGCYTPHTTSTGVVWKRNTDGNPFVGANVESIRNVRKWAEIIEIRICKIEEQERYDG